MDFTLTTPALLFSTLSLLLLAYTNRFLALATLIRNLHSQWEASHSERILPQIRNLGFRIRLIRDTQFAGVVSLMLCTVCMFLMFWDLVTPARYVFGLSLVLMIVSLLISTWEIYISINALRVHLGDLERSFSSPSAP